MKSFGFNFIGQLFWSKNGGFAIIVCVYHGSLVTAKSNYPDASWLMVSEYVWFIDFAGYLNFAYVLL